MQNSSIVGAQVETQLAETFVFHTDPGHGWLAVPYQRLVDLGIQSKITPYSYRKGDMAYLEEDLDACTFINAWLVSQGQDKTNYSYFNARCTDTYEHQSFIRNLREFYVS